MRIKEKGFKNIDFYIDVEGAQLLSETEWTAEALVTINGKTELSILQFHKGYGHPFSIVGREDELNVFHKHHVRAPRTAYNDLLKQHLGLNKLIPGVRKPTDRFPNR